MAMKKDHKGVFGTRSGGDLISQTIGGGGRSFGFGTGGRTSTVGRTTQGEARSRQSGSDLAKNFRASGKAGASVKKPKGFFGY
jgi:hypothetical protein